MSAFVDTSALYALLVRSEERHREAVAALEQLLAQARTLWTTSYVLLESTALLQHRIGLAPVRDLEDRLAPLLQVAWVDRELHARGRTRLRQLDRRRLSLVDCVSFELMDREGLRDVLALDDDFAAAGFRVLPVRVESP